MLGGLREQIRAWLTDDLSAPRKQRHTARRIPAAYGADGSIATTRTPARNSLVCNAIQVTTELPERPGVSPKIPPGPVGSRSTNEVIHGSERCCHRRADLDPQPPGQPEPRPQLRARLGERPALTQSLQTQETPLANLNPQGHRAVRQVLDLRHRAVFHPTRQHPARGAAVLSLDALHQHLPAPIRGENHAQTRNPGRPKARSYRLSWLVVLVAGSCRNHQHVEAHEPSNDQATPLKDEEPSCAACRHDLGAVTSGDQNGFVRRREHLQNVSLCGKFRAPTRKQPLQS